MRHATHPARRRFKSGKNDVCHDWCWAQNGHGAESDFSQLCG